LSGHIHGNPETFQRDRQIREQLRATGYEVIEIAASDLYDRDKMSRHFYRLGRLLVGREHAQEIRQRTDWFVHPEATEASGVSTVARILPFKKVEGKRDEQFHSCIPLMSLKAAAGGFGETMDVEPEAWVEPSTNRKLGPGMFVAQVVGHSMEPLIPGGSYALFRSPVVGSRNGRIVLVQHRDIHDSENAGSFTVKRYQSEKVSSEEGEWRHNAIRLEPLNPDYSAILLTENSEGEVQVVAEFLEVLPRSRA
jgi:SOS-response transcriptional repressor LexA